MTSSGLTYTLTALVGAMLLSAAGTWAIRPFLLRHALARPNARSSHHIPTPQGAGIAVVAATLIVAGASMTSATRLEFPIAVFGSSLLIAIIGFADDLQPIAVLPRLLLQAVAVSAVVLTSSSDLRIVPDCPVWIERAILLIAGIWFVNLVNFMDGLDWMTVAEVVPVTAAMVILGSLGALPFTATIIASALCGAMLGFAPFNRPVAKVFLGDVGSLPIGLLLGWCLLQLAWRQQFVAALLLPLYYLLDATITLLTRIRSSEPFWAAHRSHFYQRATANGFTVWRVVSEVFVLNVALAGLAIASLNTRAPMMRILLVGLGCGFTSILLRRFSRQR